MKRDHLSLAAGFLPGLSLLIVLLCRRYIQSGASMPTWTQGIPVEWIWVLVEFLVFLLPFLVLLVLFGKKKDRALSFQVKEFSVRAIPMLLTTAIAAAIANLLLGDLISGLMGQVYSDVHVFSFLLTERSSLWALLLAVVLIPVIGGQFLYGQACMRVYSPCGGIAALIVCALSYSLLTGSPATLLGTFISAVAFFYIGWAMNSVWAVMLAHGVYSIMHLLLLFVADAYSGQELWSIVRLVMIFIFGLFLYLSMHSMEQLMEKGMFRRLERLRREWLINNIIVSPGLWMTIFLFVIDWIA